MRQLSTEMRPSAMDCMDLYHYCKAYLSMPNKVKRLPIEFNCINQEFSYDNLVPNATIINLFNEKLKLFEANNAKFLKSNPDFAGMDINELFSEYLWCNTEGPIRCSTADFRLYHTPEMHTEFMAFKKDWEEKYNADRSRYERVLEYKTDDRAYKDAMAHKADALTDGGLDHRAKQCLGTLQTGKSFEVWVAQELLDNHGIDIGLYYKKSEQDHGECKEGLEFKADVLGTITKNAYLEYAESRHGKKQLRGMKKSSPVIKSAELGDKAEEETVYYGNTSMIDATIESGVAKNDNSNLMVFGTIGNIVVIRKSDLDAYIKENQVEEKASKILHKGKGNQRCRMTDKDGKPFEAVIRVENTNGQDFIASKAILMTNERLREDFAVGHSIEDLARLINEERERRERMQEQEEQEKSQDKNKSKGFLGNER